MSGILRPILRQSTGVSSSSSAICVGYGVRHDTVNDILVKGIYQNGVFIETDYTAFPVQEAQKRCVVTDALEIAYYLHPDDSSKKEDGTAASLDGTDGQVMVYRPKFYFRWWKDGDYEYHIVGESQFFGSAVWPDFLNADGSEKDHVFLSAFEGVWWDATDSSYKDHNGSTVADSNKDKLGSVAGFKPMTYQTRNEFRKMAANRGTGWHQYGHFHHEMLFLLYLTEYADFDSQAQIPGFTEGSSWNYGKVRTTGRTTSLGNASGSVYADATTDADAIALGGVTADTTVIANSYRGVENWYGHIWKWTDGININWSAELLGRVYLSSNPEDWADDTVTEYTDSGWDLPGANGYVSETHEGSFLAKSTSGGSSSTFLCDYFYQPSAAGWRVVCVGGGLSSGAFAGVGDRASLYDSGYRYSYIGGRLAA